ncbi:GIY-YIG nuclease family protein [Aliivibrio salmonicida]|uniref:GIY-YIG nuclease family protein n=1 Tax=Aliivibrio salmonicida TaxID=40269 RepID=UPI00406C251F
MAKKSKDSVGGLILLVALVAIVWLVTAVIEGITYIHQTLIKFTSTPAGLVVIFFILVFIISMLVRLYLYREVRNIKEDLDQYEWELQNKENVIELKKSELDKRTTNINKEVTSKVNAKLVNEREKLKQEHVYFNIEKDKSLKILQRLIDASYTFKVKTLLSGTTLKNQATKYDQLKKEIVKYDSIRTDMLYMGLLDSSDWYGIKGQFYDKITMLEKAQEEKETQAEIKRQIREEKQRQDELDRRQREAEEEEERLTEQRRALEEALSEAKGQYKEELEKQRQALELEIENVHAQYERAKSMAQLTKQGHVYVISNIGSFGEKVFKVGMTRRLEPMDRVKELGDASVPFDFDVHAMISCDDAPALESALHAELNSYRVNKVNFRKEFFKVDIDKIINAVEQNHGKVEYVVDPLALQYYRSLELDSEEVAA